MLRHVHKVMPGLFFFASLLLPLSVYAVPLEPLSAAEKSYVAQTAPVQVAVVLDWQPFMYRGADGRPQGLVFDLLEKITAITGVHFNYVHVQTFDEATRKVADGSLDILGVMALGGTPPKGLLASSAYLEAFNLFISGKHVSSPDLSRLTMAELNGSTMPRANKAQNVLFFPTLRQCLEAVRNGRADYAKINLYTAQMLLWQLGPNGFNVRILPNEEVRFGFAVSATSPQLLSILKKGMSAITPEERQLMLARHSIQPGSDTVGWMNFIYLYSLEILCATLPLMMLLLIGFFSFFRIRSRNSQKISGYEESYRLLANTLGEVGIEYDYIEDKVIFMGRSRDLLALDSHIEDFREKLKNKELPLSLSLDDFNQVLQNGVAGKTSVAEFQCQLREKGWAWFQLVCTVVCTEESHRRPVRLIGCLVNVDAERRETALLRDLSQIDPLTDLLNRATGNKYIRDSLPLCTAGRSAALLLMDVDNFKHFNDNYGHLAGDQVLKALAAAMKDVFRAHDVLCRWGGDEFLIFLQDMGNKAEKIRDRTEALRAKLKDYKDSTGAACPITVSIGGTIVENNIDLDALFQQADDALYEIKKQGRDGFLMYAPGMGKSPQTAAGGRNV